ncbi:MAG: hypothetical protein IJM98_05730 [Oscillospiraceae bacterium]|nr:hypothetical protein [Oscillospiraceae bacterium]
MVTKTQARRKQDIKSKLMAAIAMLLVSSIMMVSSTYAWFTLSTAPEVTGISTAVGANGNLEIALLPKTGDTNAIGSAVGDSMLAIEAKNTTWGNLVDLSDNSVYGLDAITLYPAALNGTYGGDNNYLSTIGSVMLQTPTYGSDGRVATLNPNTSNGYYNATEKNFFPNSDMGVRAIGTASGMTDRQLEYRNARSAANTASAQAKSVASSSLNNNGSTLANIAIKKGTGSTSYDLDDINALKTIVDDLLGTDSKTGVLQHIENAYKQYILAYAASGAVPVVTVQGENGAEEADVQPWNAVKGLVSGTLANMLTGLSTAGVGNLPDAFTDATTAYATTLASVEEAETKIDELLESGNTSFGWDDVSEILYCLADPDKMEVNGILAKDIMYRDENGETPNMSALVNSVASGGLKVTMKSEGGVYADIADHCGDYNVSVVIEEVSYNGLKLSNMTARMETKSDVKPARLTVANSAVESAGAPASGDTSDQPITDMFGYVIDLAFRTNAAESKLMLQKNAVDRIYSDNDNEGTMGHGSNMTFNLVSSELIKLVGEGENATQDYTKLKELTGAIRMVFFVPGEDSNQVIACGRLDAANAAMNSNGEWVADIILYDEVATTTSSTDEEGNTTTSTTISTVDRTATGDGNYEIMPLTQNQAHKLSVLVYLDGNHVVNDDVAAAAATSMVGKLNLQFSSSATLVPMDYAQLHTPATSGGTTTPDTPAQGGDEEAGNEDQNTGA